MDKKKVSKHYGILSSGDAGDIWIANVRI